MSLGHATGWVEIEGQRTAFRDAPFYAEKNWGRGFPRKWWWLQCNAFDDVEPASQLTLTATGARRSLLAGGALEREEDVGLVGIHWDGGVLALSRGRVDRGAVGRVARDRVLRRPGHVLHDRGRDLGRGLRGARAVEERHGRRRAGARTAACSA